MADEHIEEAGSLSGLVLNAAALRPVLHRKAWIASGIFLQLVAVAMPITVVVTRAKHDSVAGTALRATVLVAARDLLHSSSGLAILVGSAVVFALGSVVLARPFVHSLGTLLVAVPLAAVVGVLILGLFAVVVAIVVALFWLDADVPGGSGRTGQAAQLTSRGTRSEDEKVSEKLAEDQPEEPAGRTRRKNPPGSGRPSAEISHSAMRGLPANLLSRG